MLLEFVSLLETLVVAGIFFFTHREANDFCKNAFNGEIKRLMILAKGFNNLFIMYAGFAVFKMIYYFFGA